MYKAECSLCFPAQLVWPNTVCCLCLVNLIPSASIAAPSTAVWTHLSTGQHRSLEAIERTWKSIKYIKYWKTLTFSSFGDAVHHNIWLILACVINLKISLLFFYFFLFFYERYYPFDLTCLMIGVSNADL